MIHIFNKIIQLKIVTLQDLYDEYIKTTDIKQLVCPNPKCKSKGNLKVHQYYPRKLTMYICGLIIDGEIRVLVVWCKSCDHTHAILPDFIVPYKRHSTNIIIECLKDKLSKLKISDICEKYKISIQTIYNWLKVFSLHKPYYEMFFSKGKLSLLEIINKIYSYIHFSSFLEQYFLEHKKYFLRIIRSP